MVKVDGEQPYAVINANFTVMNALLSTYYDSVSDIRYLQQEIRFRHSSFTDHLLCDTYLVR